MLIVLLVMLGLCCCCAGVVAVWYISSQPGGGKKGLAAEDSIKANSEMDAMPAVEQAHTGGRASSHRSSSESSSDVESGATSADGDSEYHSTTGLNIRQNLGLIPPHMRAPPPAATPAPAPARPKAGVSRHTAGRPQGYTSRPTVDGDQRDSVGEGELASMSTVQLKHYLEAHGVPRAEWGGIFNKEMLREKIRRLGSTGTAFNASGATMRGMQHGADT